MKPLKILMLEDNESDAGLIKGVLKKSNLNFESIVVDTKEEYIKGLQDFVPDAIFSDHSLPQFNSLEAFEALKISKLNIPFILVTGTISEEFAEQCMKEGIDDFILKDNLYRLPIALTNALNLRKLEFEKQKLENEQINYIEKLKAKNQELIKLNYELDRFVYSSSHELKAPLTSILGLAYLIKEDLSKENYETVVQYLLLIEQSVDKLIRTIEEIIYYAINNHTSVQIEKINPKLLLDTIWNRLKYTGEASKIIPKFTIEKHADWHSDKKRLMIIFENLLSNAIKFRDERKNEQLIFIDITINKENVSILVSDNGIGIQKKHIDKIFNMFYRASNESDGSGLGLYLAKETIFKLKGTIKVKSKIEEGTTFSIELPNSK